MAKWADYVITHKRMNSRRTHIDKVRACEDTGDQLGSSYELTRQEVIAKLKQNITFVAAYQGNDGKYKLGEKVIIVTINYTEYIKTIPDKTERDNLDNLPDF